MREKSETNYLKIFGFLPVLISIWDDSMIARKKLTPASRAVYIKQKSKTLNCKVEKRNVTVRLFG